MEIREEIVKAVCNSLMSKGMSQEDLHNVKNVLYVKLDKYEIQHRCTEIVPVDTSSERLLKKFEEALMAAGKSKHTVRSYISILKRLMIERNKPLAEMERDDIRAFLCMMEYSDNTKNSSVKSYRAFISSFYSWMIEEGRIAKNPMVSIKPIKCEEEIEPPFDDYEVDLIRGNCKNERLRAVIELLLSTGIRIEELCKLNRRDIDFTNLELIIRSGKGKKSRQVFFTPMAAIYLRNYLNTRTDTETCLFCNKRGNRLVPKNVRDQLYKIEKLTNIEHIHPHRFRATFATNQIRRGMDVKALQLLMGHSSVDMTMRYVRLSMSHVRNEYAKCN